MYKIIQNMWFCFIIHCYVEARLGFCSKIKYIYRLAPGITIYICLISYMGQNQSHSPHMITPSAT